MAILADLHMHSNYSGDSEAPMEEMILSAIDKGLKTICFTEHQDFDFVYTEDEPKDKFEVNADQYLYDLLGLKSKYKDKIEVFFGIELGLQSHISRKLAMYSKSHDFDFIIGSSHLCNGKDPYLASFFEGRTEEEAYHEYFKYELECIKGFRNFDVYGHLDYVLRYGPNMNRNFSMSEYGDDISAVLSMLIENEKGIEINTSGYAYKMGGPHPCKDILKRYKELGGEIITIGSDAHTPDRVGQNFEEAAQLLKECGFKYYSVYSQRLPEMFPL